jgi:hypothetical protein
LENVAELIPCRRQTSAVAMPASCSFTIAMICSSENLLRFIRPSPRETDSTQKWHQFRGARHRHFANERINSPERAVRDHASAYLARINGIL